MHERLACLLCSRVLGCLAAVISQARRLTPKEQVPALPSCCNHGSVGLNTTPELSFPCHVVFSPCSKALKAIQRSFLVGVQVNVAGALSSIAVFAARRSFQLETPGAATGTQSPAIPKGPFVLDQVACPLQTRQHVLCLIARGASQCDSW